jgi:hypothetical protein
LATNCGPLSAIFFLPFHCLLSTLRQTIFPVALCHSARGHNSCMLWNYTKRAYSCCLLDHLSTLPVPGTHTKLGFLIALFKPRLLLSMDSKSDNGWTRSVLRGNDHASWLP